MYNDFGDYFCMASNEFSVDKANFSLFLAGKLLLITSTHVNFMYLWTLEVPSAPVNVTAMVLGSREANISWQDGISSIHGNPPTLDYQVLLNNSLITNVSTTSIPLDTLLPFMTYGVIIFARNKIGISNSSESVIFMTHEEGKLIVISWY